MKGSARPVLLLLALLVVGAVAAVYYVTKPAGAPEGSTPALTERGPDRPAADRPPDVPETPPGPSRSAPETVARGPAAMGDVNSYANAIVGDVRDAEGKPVDGAEVSAQKGPALPLASFLQPAAMGGPVFRARSDREGRFRLASLPPSESYLVRATHKDHPPVELTSVSV